LFAGSSDNQESAYSDPDFLASVHAQVAVISVGQDNDYGLPAPSLIAELAKLGVATKRTDRDGDVAIVDTNGRLGAVTRGVSASTS
jgi:competence protein ComEC